MDVDAAQKALLTKLTSELQKSMVGRDRRPCLALAVDYITLVLPQQTIRARSPKSPHGSSGTCWFEGIRPGAV